NVVAAEVERAQQVAHVPERGVGDAVVDLVEDGLLRVEHLDGVLAEVAYPHPRADHGLTVGGLDLSGENLEERGLAGAVDAHDRDALETRDDGRGVAEDEL